MTLTGAQSTSRLIINPLKKTLAIKKIMLYCTAWLSVCETIEMAKPIPREVYNTAAITRVKFNQLYNITASHDGYQPASVLKQVIQGNATAFVNISLEKTMDWGFIGIIVIIVIVVLILVAVLRLFGRRPGHHVMRKNEI